MGKSLTQATAWGLRNRRGAPMGSQAIGVLLRNQLYAGIVAVPEYGVHNQRGDFDPVVSEDVIFRAQAVLSGRPPIAAPKLRSHPDFPLSKFVRCEACGRGLRGAGRRVAASTTPTTTAGPGAAGSA